jgi:hypothetical protein
VLHLGAVRFSITRPGRYTTTAHEALDLCRLLRPRTVPPIHYEGWGHFGGGHQASADGQTFSYLADAVVPIEHESRARAMTSVRPCAGSRWAAPSRSDHSMPPVNEASTSEKALCLLETDPPYSRHSTQLRQPRPHRNCHYG